MEITAEQRYLDNENLVYTACNLLMPIEQQDSRMSLVGLSREDLHQEGKIGLWKACQKFDVDKGNEFSTFAISYIQGFVKNLLNRSFSVKFPRDKMKNEEKLAIEISNISLNAPVPGDGEGSREMIECLDESVLFNNRNCEELDVDFNMEKALSFLSDKEKHVIHSFFVENKQQKDIAAENGVSPQAIAHHKKSALKKLKSRLHLCTA